MKRGFTLVELSIVLVIIGLLIGGILIAQSMVDTARITSFVKRMGEYEIAFNNFKGTYGRYPGDSRFFTPTGNEDNALLWGGGGNFATCNGIYENLEYIQFFGHLTQSGMLKEKTLRVFDPVFCGGTLPVVGGQQSYEDIAYPTFELDSKAAEFTGFKKEAIVPSKTAASNLRFRFEVNASWVIPLETKFGYVANSNTAIGISNMLFAQGNCYDADYNLVQCGNSGAIGEVMIHFPPI